MAISEPSTKDIQSHQSAQKQLTVRGNFETDLEPLLSGSISGTISDEVEPYSKYVSIIDANDYWYVTLR